MSSEDQPKPNRRPKEHRWHTFWHAGRSKQLAKSIPLTGYVEYPPEQMVARAAAFLADIGRRRTVRDYSDRPVPREVIEQCLLAAGRAPRRSAAASAA